MGKKYGRLTSDADITTGTEYGGVDGMIQPPPHVPGNHSEDMLRQVYQTNPSAGAIQYKDGTTDVEDQPIPATKKIV
jgi:hypothetical protein